MKASDLRETIGFLGVAASLVFVGLEVRQNTKVARGQARQELAALNQEWLILQATDSAFNAIFRRTWIEPDSALTASETSRAMVFKDIWVTRNERRAYDPGFVRYFENRAGLAPK